MGKTLMAAILLGLGWSSMGGKPARPKRRTIYQTVTDPLPTIPEVTEDVGEFFVDLGETAVDIVTTFTDPVTNTYQDVIDIVESRQMETTRVMGGPQGIVPVSFTGPPGTIRVMGGPGGIIAVDRPDTWWERGMDWLTEITRGSGSGSDVHQY